MAESEEELKSLLMKVKEVIVTIFLRDRKRDTDVQNSLMDSVGEGEGGKIWENGIETCNIMYEKNK